MHHFLRLCVAATAAITAHAHGAPVACSAAENVVAIKAATDADTALQGAIVAIDAGTNSALIRLDRWFGIRSSDKSQALKARLENIRTWLSKSSFLCENQTHIKLGDVYAYVNPQQGLTITLGAFFFQAPESGTLSTKLGVLVHEAAHYSLAGAAKDPKVYGPAEALVLAKSSASEAQANAENIEYFVESLHFNLTP
jgi:Lysine-specific metallo-endopeptidase